MSRSSRRVYSAAVSVPDDRRQQLDRPWPDLLLDVGPVVALLASGLIVAALQRERLPVQLAFMIVLLVARRRWPLAVLVGVAAIAVGTSEASPGPWIQVSTVAFASFTTGERGGDRTRSALSVLLVAALMSGGFLAREGEPFESLVLPFVVLVPSWLVGDVVRTRRAETTGRLEAAERAAVAAEARLEAAVTEERRRMARELHDVVAHAVSVMVIQAGAARQVLRTSPERAEESLLTVEATGRDAMAELRRMLGVLNDDGEAGGLAPQPGLDQLGALLDRVRDAGLPTELRIDGVPRAIPASMDVTIYRIVQEALTNALRYARQASTLVHISYEPEQLRIEVLDDGPGAEPGASDGTGRGLAGMHQRAAGVGGRLEAGPRLGGGYAVRAWLPIEPVRL
jgi:signal transduction histidine kinase